MHWETNFSLTMSEITDFSFSGTELSLELCPDTRQSTAMLDNSDTSGAEGVLSTAISRSDFKSSIWDFKSLKPVILICTCVFLPFDVILHLSVKNIAERIIMSMTARCKSMSAHRLTVRVCPRLFHWLSSFTVMISLTIII